MWTEPVRDGESMGMGEYRKAYDRSIDDPEGFWLEQAELVDWFRKPERALDDERPPFYRWFPDGVLNTCRNALDRHVAAGNGQRTAADQTRFTDRADARLRHPVTAATWMPTATCT